MTDQADQAPQDAPAPDLKDWLLAPEARTETLTPPPPPTPPPARRHASPEDEDD